MIEINLLPGKKKKKAKGLGMSLPEFGELLRGIRDPLLIGAIASWAIVLPVVGFIYVTETAEVAALRDEADQIRVSALRFQNVIREKRRQERLLDSLVVELAAIREIDADRYVWAHIMDEIAKALPDFTWLTAVENMAPQPTGVGDEGEPVDVPVRFLIAGRTADINAYTRFLRNLEESPWIANVRAGQTTQVQEDERLVLEFAITAAYEQADSAFIRIAPLQETLR